VDPDSAKASFKNGVLQIEISEKVQTESCRKISIKQDA
jgi:HSP20 family molecular chaperone IbpA